MMTSGLGDLDPVQVSSPDPASQQSQALCQRGGAHLHLSFLSWPQCLEFLHEGSILPGSLVASNYL